MCMRLASSVNVGYVWGGQARLRAADHTGSKLSHSGAISISASLFTNHSSSNIIDKHQSCDLIVLDSFLAIAR